MNYFDVPVYIINLPKHLDRKNHMINLMKELNFKKFKFIEPFKANQSTKKLLETFINKKIDLSLSKCSHTLTYLNLLLSIPDEKCFIFEDDIKLVSSIEKSKENLNFIVNNNKLDIHLIYLEMCYENCNYLERDKNFIQLNTPFCTAAMFYPSKYKRYEIIKYIRNSNLDNYAMDVIYAHNNKILKELYQIIFQQDNKFGSFIEGSVGYMDEKKPLLELCRNIQQTPNNFNKSILILPTTFKNLSYQRIRNFYIKNNNIYYLLIFIFIFAILYICFNEKIYYNSSY